MSEIQSIIKNIQNIMRNMNTDLTFVTNEKNQTLLDRFRVLIKCTNRCKIK